MKDINELIESFSLDTVIENNQSSRFFMDFNLDQPFKLLNGINVVEMHEGERYLLGTSSFDEICFQINPRWKSYNFQIKKDLESLVFSLLNRTLNENGLEQIRPNYEFEKKSCTITLDGVEGNCVYRLDIIKKNEIFQFDVVKFDE